MLLIDLQHILIYLAQACRDRHKLGRAKFLWYLTCHGLNLLVDELSGLQRRHVLLEHNGHKRESEARYRTYLSDVHDIAHGNLDRHGDELFDLLRCQCR